MSGLEDRDLSLLEATQKSLRDNMKICKELQARIAKYKSFNEEEVARLQDENEGLKDAIKLLTETLKNVTEALDGELYGTKIK